MKQLARYLRWVQVEGKLMVLHLHSWVQAAYYLRHNKWVSQLSKDSFGRECIGNGDAGRYGLGKVGSPAEESLSG